jgi:peptide deformylase
VENYSENLCPCSSGISYDNCCKYFHEGKLPENALQLMRSRYAAYVLDKPEYIIKTTHPASPQFSENKFSWKRGISEFSKSSTFKKLEILDFKEHNTLATVTFTAYVIQEDRDATFTEKSYFEKIGDRWLYRVGQLAEGRALSLVTSGELKLLPLAYYGDAVLRKKGEPIIEITDDLRLFVERMIETMDASNGFGLAAPQVHHSIRLFITRIPVEVEKDKFEPGEVQVFINPKLSSPSDETWKASEGCLSIPTIYGDVERPNEITVEYTALEGDRRTKRFSGWLARAIMHENDHINGVLFIDRLEKETQAKLGPFLKNLEKRTH